MLLPSATFLLPSSQYPCLFSPVCARIRSYMYAPYINLHYRCFHWFYELFLPDAPKSVSVSMDLTEIIEGSSVTLTCSCDAKPAAKFRWYKNNQTLLHEGPHLILGSVYRSDSRKYHCVAENELGKTASEHAFINVECESNKETRKHIFKTFLMCDRP
uniref:Ig-like domain-containing protein n=1 Tax=Oryzias melastigma TaxID=30732 RepID=A0A3B3CBB5_ORYME